MSNFQQDHPSQPPSGYRIKQLWNAMWDPEEQAAQASRPRLADRSGNRSGDRSGDGLADGLISFDGDHLAARNLEAVALQPGIRDLERTHDEPPEEAPPLPDDEPFAWEGMEKDLLFANTNVYDLAQAEGPDEDPDEEGHRNELFSPLKVRDRVVIMLLFKEVITSAQAERAWKEWKRQSHTGTAGPLWRALLLDPSLDRERIFAEAAEVYAFKKARVRKFSTLSFLREVKDVFSQEQWGQMQELNLLPFLRNEHPQTKRKQWVFITHDPTRPEVKRFLQQLNLDFQLFYALEAEIRAIFTEDSKRTNKYLDRVRDGQFAYDLGTKHDERHSLIDENALEAEISRSSLINLFEAALIEAVRQGASDIHIFPNARKEVEIHFRLDGELTCWHVEERVHPEAFLAVVKDKANNIDRFERDAAQDGYLQRVIDHTLIRFRVSVLPLASSSQDLRSESIVIRVLDDRKVITNLTELGFQAAALNHFEDSIRQPYGMVILTGPTGSGKSTTLYAALHHIISPKLNILTIEDPVEYAIAGVRQIKLNHKLKLEEALRSVLRHDPDVVMVGEMRDLVTAELAMQLANTGHLTFSTLHTNDAASSISRLYKMGIEPFLIAYSINLVVAQRLVRVLCSDCKQIDTNVSAFLLERLGFTKQQALETPFYKAGDDEGCRTCKGTGYRGRRAITETMLFSDDLRRLIVSSNEFIDEGRIKKQAVLDGMVTLQESARLVVQQGETSLLEMVRVVASGFTGTGERRLVAMA